MGNPCRFSRCCCSSLPSSFSLSHEQKGLLLLYSPLQGLGRTLSTSSLFLFFDDFHQKNFIFQI